jgi:hypothetical protein
LNNQSNPYSKVATPSLDIDEDEDNDNSMNEDDDNEPAAATDAHECNESDGDQ